jgi:transcriptional regulator with XRE-family HTH domain
MTVMILRGFCNCSRYAALMQEPVVPRAAENVGAVHDFGEKMRAARSRAAMSQAHLQARLKDEFRMKLDTSGITRIEAGQREPRLSEVIAIAAVLGIEISDLLPPTRDLDRRIRDIADLLSRTREDLAALFQAADELTEYVKNNPDSLGGAKLQDLVGRAIDRARAEINTPPAQKPKVADTAQKLRRQLLSAVTA